MRRLTILFAVPTLAASTLAACASGDIPLLEDEVRAPGSTDRRARVIRDDRAAMPDRMGEIRAARRMGTPPLRDAEPAAFEASPVDAFPLETASAPSARLDETLPAPGALTVPPRPVPRAAVPSVSNDPYFAAADTDLRTGAGELEAIGTAPRIGAPARVGAAPAPEDDPFQTALADDAPFALRGDAAPTRPAIPAAPTGQPAYPLDPAYPLSAETSPLPIGQGAPGADGTFDTFDTAGLPTAQAGQSEGMADAYVADPAGTLSTINGLRARYGLGPLRYDPLLSAVALSHARDLAARGEIASTSRTGEGVLARARVMGAAPSVAGSLVAGGYADVPAALTTWRADKAQRDRLLLAEADTLGLALVDDRRSPFRYYIEAIVAAE